MENKVMCNTAQKENDKAKGVFMTTKEIAEVLNVDVRTIQRASNKLFDPTTVLSQVVNGGKSMVFNEKQVTAIKQEVQSHHNLSNRNIDNVSTDIEKMQKMIEGYSIAMDFLNEYKKRAELAEQQLIEAKPKVEFYDDVTGSNDTIDMRDVATTVNVKGYGRNNIFALLRRKQVLDKNNQPYQKYVDNGCFRTVESKYTLPTGEIKISIKTVVFQKGLDLICKLIKGE